MSRALDVSDASAPTSTDRSRVARPARGGSARAGCWSSARSARCAGVLLVALTAVAPARAWAEAPPPRLSTEARAEQLFESGKKKFDSGTYAEACEDFSASLKLGPKLGTLLNLALCHETVGKPVTAWHEFSHAAAWAAQNGQRDRHDFATQHVRALELKLPRVVLQLPTDRAIAGLDIDGEPVPETRWYMPLFLDPGEHHIAVTAPGKERTSVAFRVTSAATDQLVYIPRLPDQAPSDAQAPQEPAPEIDRTRRLIGIIGLGGAAAAAAVGTTFGVLAMTGDERDPAVKDHATAATIAFAGSVALAAAGGWALWTSTHSGARARIAASPRPGGAALWVGASF